MLYSFTLIISPEYVINNWCCQTSVSLIFFLWVFERNRTGIVFCRTAATRNCHWGKLWKRSLEFFVSVLFVYQTQQMFPLFTIQSRKGCFCSKLQNHHLCITGVCFSTYKKEKKVQNLEPVKCFFTKLYCMNFALNIISFDSSQLTFDLYIKISICVRNILQSKTRWKAIMPCVGTVKK